MKPARFEQIISFENLLKAHQKARCCKQHKKEVIEFEMHLSRNLWALHYDLKYHKYRIGEYRKFMIYDPKEREIQAIPYKDRIVQHSVCDNLLIPLFFCSIFLKSTKLRKDYLTMIILAVLIITADIIIVVIMIIIYTRV